MMECDSSTRTMSVELPKTRDLNEREVCDLEMLLMGAFAPLEGYMTRDEYEGCVENMRLPTGSVFSIPIVLTVPKSSTTPTATPSQGPQRLVLRDLLGVAVAEVAVTDIWEPDLEREMQKVLGTTDRNHPYASYMAREFTDCYYIGGQVRQLAAISRFDFLDLRRSAADVKERIAKLGWKSVVGFQTRNPMHRSHFELTQHALREVEKETGQKAHLLLTPAVGPTQPGDIEYHIRVRCYKKLLKRYEESGAAAELILLPLAMRMAGPREAIWHSIIRRNYGCTHFIVGRDHAGPSAKRQDGSPFYGPYEAHELLTSVASDLGIKAVFGKAMVYIGEENGGYVEADKVPQGVEAQNISGTQQREMLQNRQPIPEWFSYPDVVEELQKSYLPSWDRGICISLEGPPFSGKKALAKALEAVLLAGEEESRQVSIVDTKVVPPDYQPKVCGELTKHRALCILASGLTTNQQRDLLKSSIRGAEGVLVEVRLDCSDTVLEERRRYAASNKDGVRTDYEITPRPDVVLKSEGSLLQGADTVMTFLRQHQYIR